MKLAAMQPYFFPYLGQIDLINRADTWIVYDQGQYIRHGWVNRNRVLHPTSGWWYITVPLKKHPLTAPINQIEIANDLDWKTTIMKRLEHYHMDAPYYSQVIGLLKEILSHSYHNLARLNIESFKAICSALEIETPVHVYSELNWGQEKRQGPEDIALGICQAAGASEYLNPPGGAGLYNPDAFSEHGIKLTIQSFTNMTYDCGRYQFVPNLSIIDVMMWNSRANIKHYLDMTKENEG